ncbi:MAG: hypothetical protein ABI670_01880 [Chloroflexota bacterium]
MAEQLKYHDVGRLMGYHSQDELIGCGWTAAQMVLNDMMPATYVHQQHYLDEDLKLGQWFAEPNSLRRLLTERQPNNNTRPFQLFQCGSEASASQLIAKTIFEKQVAPCVLVWDFYHWVVVYGCDATQKANGTYDIEAFYIHDPAPGPTDTSRDQRKDYDHENDDLCGTGGEWGIAYSRISYPYWRQTWLTGVSRNIQPSYSGSFVVVAVADDNAKCPPVHNLPAGLRKPPLPQQPGKAPGDSHTLKLVKDAAVNQLQELVGRKDCPEPWKSLGTNIKAKSVRFVGFDPPIPDQFRYWLVEISPTDDINNVPVAVRLETTSPYTMLETAAVRVKQPGVGALEGDALRASDVARAERRLNPRRIAPGRKPQDSRIRFGPNHAESYVVTSVKSTLVWPHILAFPSPFAPVYKSIISYRDDNGKRGKVVIYRRLDDDSLEKQIMSHQQLVDISSYIERPAGWPDEVTVPEHHIDESPEQQNAVQEKHSAAGRPSKPTANRFQ